MNSYKVIDKINGQPEKIKVFRREKDAIDDAWEAWHALTSEERERRESFSVVCVHDSLANEFRESEIISFDVFRVEAAAWEKREEIIERLLEIDAEAFSYQVDLYIRPDGSVYEFHNPGGNSYPGYDGFRIWTINHEYDDDWNGKSYEERIEALGDYGARETFDGVIDDFIDKIYRCYFRY